ncbi:unnamed protein product [Nippostrongylus brasiliensis]|uniref:Drongo (inferred by orthology to a D. melanogaster protein) n=1 Tax=Nippostrongylus brasiliensis TaxID=27835 RepID=A0A0N4YCM9_NIPBR|nr:unnamed protein product [Nippostrongylus brasiliensis]
MVNAAHNPSSNSTLSAQKKRQDEKNLKTLRRGLNPPHRVKSICMATFTNEEIERVRSLGNEENSHTWLALYSGTPPKMTNKDELTAFLIKKYEKKEWYVSRSELAEQERLLNQSREAPSQCGTSVKSTGSSSSKPSDLDLFATDPFAAFGAPINRPVPHSNASQENQDVSDPFAPVPPKNTTSEFDPFANFDAKFSELALKNSSTVSERVPTSAPVAPEQVPVTGSAGNSDKYSALAELDQMFHHTTHPNASGDKPAWMPSGFSTGLPPAHYTAAFPDSSQPRSSASSGFGSIPKSNTLGAIAEMGTAATPMVAPVDVMQQQQTFSSSYANLASNPFIQQQQQPFVDVPQYYPVHPGSGYPNTSGVTWNNPFVMPIAQVTAIRVHFS